MGAEGAFTAVAGLEGGDHHGEGGGWLGGREWERGWEEGGEPVFEEAGRVVEGLGGRGEVRGEGAGDLVGGGVAGQPGVDGRGEAAYVVGGEEQSGVGQPEPGEEIGGWTFGGGVFGGWEGCGWGCRCGCLLGLGLRQGCG